jgi:predicted ester cyclase
VSDSAEAARTIVQFFASGDLSSLTAAIADDYVDHQGLGGVEIRGQDGFRQVVEAARQHAGLKVTIEDLVAMDDKVALRLRWTGFDIEGRSVARETLDLLRFTEGRLAEHWGAGLRLNEA